MSDPKTRGQHHPSAERPKDGRRALSRRLPLRQTLKALAGDRRGVIVVMFALMLPILIGFIGLGVEVGSWYQNKRDLQTIADAAAIAGAFTMNSGGTGTEAEASATTDAGRNGYDSTTDTINVDNPPATGAYTADVLAVEVNLTRQVQLLFAGYFMNNAVTIGARAVATTMASTDTACVLALETAATGVSVGGSAAVNINGCQVASNSSSATSIEQSGNGTLTTDCYTTVGTTSGTINTDAGCSPKNNSAAIADPYADLVAPDEPCDVTGGYNYNVNGGTTTITGNSSYTNAYVICGDFWVQKGTVTLAPGLYVIKDGDFKTNAQGSIQGTGVTIVLQNSQINNINGGSTVNLSAPVPADNAGDWEGMLFYQDRDTNAACTGNNCNTLNGGASTTFQGVVYFPNQEINVNGGNSASSPCLQVVALRLSFKGNAGLNSDSSACTAAGVTGVPLPGNVGLVE